MTAALPKIERYTIRKAVLRLGEHLRAGIDLDTAVCVIGVSRHQFARWMSQGREEFENNQDTAHARAFVFVSRALAEAKGLAISQTYLRDPKWWLQHAPHTKDQWRDDAKEGAAISINLNQTAAVVSGGGAVAVPADYATRAQALLAMEEAGVLTLSPEARAAITQTAQQGGSEGGADDDDGEVDGDMIEVEAEATAPAPSVAPALPAPKPGHIPQLQAFRRNPNGPAQTQPGKGGNGHA